MKRLLATLLAIVSFTTVADDWKTGISDIVDEMTPAQLEAADLYYNVFGGDPKDYRFIEADIDHNGINDVLVNDDAVNVHWQHYTTVDGKFKYVGQIARNNLYDLYRDINSDFMIPESKVYNATPLSFNITSVQNVKYLDLKTMIVHTTKMAIFENTGRIVTLDEIKTTINNGQCKTKILNEPFRLSTANNRVVVPKHIVRLGDYIYTVFNPKCNVIKLAVNDGVDTIHYSK